MDPLPIGQRPIFVIGFFAGVIFMVLISFISGKEPHERVKKLGQNGDKR